MVARQPCYTTTLLSTFQYVSPTKKALRVTLQKPLCQNARSPAPGLRFLMFLEKKNQTTKSKKPNKNKKPTKQNPSKPQNWFSMFFPTPLLNSALRTHVAAELTSSMGSEEWVNLLLSSLSPLQVCLAFCFSIISQKNLSKRPNTWSQTRKLRSQTMTRDWN